MSLVAFVTTIFRAHYVTCNAPARDRYLSKFEESCRRDPSSMSDARFASLKTDPRFRRLKKRSSKVVLDDRFKHLLGDDKGSKKNKKKSTQGACTYPVSHPPLVDS